MDNKIKYQYAKAENGNSININDLQKTPEVRNSKYYCFSCGHELIPVLGEIRQKHFRHLKNIECNFETYLHNLAKGLFFEVYNQCLESNEPFEINLFQEIICDECGEFLTSPCVFRGPVIGFDLIKFFPDIRLECQYDGFVPDILLSNDKGEVLFIEFAVTHFCSESKSKSSYRVIELQIIDESSLNPILDMCLSQDNEEIQFYNFVTPQKNISLNPKCNKTFPFFLLKSDGSAAIRDVPIRSWKKRNYFKKFVYLNQITETSIGIDNIYISELIKAQKSGRNVRNCFLCRYHAKNEYRYRDDRPIFCKFQKKVFSSTAAVECQYYRIDQKVINYYLDEISKMENAISEQSI